MGEGQENLTLENLRGKRVGLVLSGGGVRGLAHVGLLRALDEYGIEIDMISGTSAGALVGALYAAGKDNDTIRNFFKSTSLFSYHYLTIQKPGLLDTERYYKVFRTFFPQDTFESLHKQLFVTTTNLQLGTAEVFSSGPLIRALLASAALPPVFSPVQIGEYLYADGGIMNNFPLEPLSSCDYLIGSNVAKIRKLEKKDISSSFQLANRTSALMIYAINHQKMKNCDLLFEPPNLDRIGVLDKKGLELAFSIGYEHALSILGKNVSLASGDH
ncbi:MAG: patatin-like phospholipase family protein [Flavobacteriaceae bacterium]|nr:patatin-like phospholipase family protein [Flavobacteriaceae bacterium]